MYSFRLYYSVRGANRRRVKLIKVGAFTLRDAWVHALDMSAALT